jgi:hypothetical protein
LEEKELKFLEAEFNKTKAKLDEEYKQKLIDYEFKLRLQAEKFQKQVFKLKKKETFKFYCLLICLNFKENDLDKRQTIVDERRNLLQEEWKKLNDEEAKIDDFKKEIRKRYLNDAQEQLIIKPHLSQNEKIEFELNQKLEVEKLKVEKDDLEKRLNKLQKLFNNLYENKNSNQSIELKSITNNDQNDNNNDVETSSSSILNSKFVRNAVRKVKSGVFDELDDDDDESEIKEVIRNAKLKVKLKYIQAKKEASDDMAKSNSYDTDDNSELNDYHLSIRKLDSEINDHKKFLLEELNKEKDSLKIANELLEKHKQSLFKRKVRLEIAQGELKSEEESVRDIVQNKSDYLDKNKQKVHLIEERKLVLEKEALDLERLGLNIKSNKRLVKQKADQLSLLEHSIINTFDNENEDDDDDYDDEEEKTNNFDFDVDTEAQNENEKTFNRSNVDDLMVKLKKMQTSGNINKSVNMNKIQPLVKSITKLTNQLNKGIESIEISQSKLKPESFIDRKWKQYFNEVNNNNRNNTVTYPNTIKNETSSKVQSTTIRGAWETSPTYHKLTYDSNNRLLNEKWSKYIGDFDNFHSTSLINSTRPAANRSSITSIHHQLQQQQQQQQHTRNLKSSSSINGLSSSLPASIQQRINEHREWLRKFKADLMYSNQINSSNETNFIF